MKPAFRQALWAPLIDQNPITLHILGICSAVAITNSLYSALVMSAALTGVLCFASVTISAIRHQLPHSVRIIVQVTVIASAVIVVDELLKAFAPATSQILTVFVGLIITNCIVLGRSEAFAARNPVSISFADAVGNGLGYSLILCLVAATRELFGTGGLLGWQLIATRGEGGWYEPNALLLLPPSAFFIIGGIVWAIRSRNPQQREQPEFEIIASDREEYRQWS